jgi:hypothetical protein
LKWYLRRFDGRRRSTKLAVASPAVVRTDGVAVSELSCDSDAVVHADGGAATELSLASLLEVVLVFHT